jgi:hypothetical protein
MAEFVKAYWPWIAALVVLLVIIIGANVYLEAATDLLPGGGKS